VDRTERLRDATDQTLQRFEDLQIELGQTPSMTKVGHLLLLEQQLRGLRVLKADLSAGAPRRRTWSLGQAAAPVLEIVLQSATNNSDCRVEFIDRCRESLVAFNAALTDQAEGR